MVAEEDAPLTVLGDARGLRHDVGDGQPVFLPERHVDARHQREVEGHMALVAIAEVRAHIFGPLVGFGEDQAAFVAFVDGGADFLDGGMGFRQVFAVGAVALDQVRDGVHAQAVDAHVEPEPHDVDDFFDDAGVVEVEIGLVRKETVPIVGVGHRVPGPVGLFSVGKDDAGIFIKRVRVAPNVHFTLGRVRRGFAGGLEPGVLVGGVIDDEFHHDLHVAVVGGVEKALEIVNGPIAGIDRQVVRDVVAIVAQGRREERKEPDAGDAEVLEVVELAEQAGKVADAVVVGVGKGAHMELVNDGVLVPKWVGRTSLPLHCCLLMGSVPLTTNRWPGWTDGSSATKLLGPCQV